MGLSSTNALGLSNITAAPASFVNTSLGSSSATNSHGLPIKAVTNEQKHSPPETQAPAPTMLQKVESAQSVACESLPARISPGPSSQVEDGANAVKNLSLEHIRTSSAHETVSRTSTSASGGDSTKPVEM
ncbi:hypothetical protein BC830DRAFT_496682 [Chytriomyces sp. MP71]|nr:hypothetical protein BC830DRAFT_496682 [Chytriomyces sp. MP71]